MESPTNQININSGNSKITSSNKKLTKSKEKIPKFEYSQEKSMREMEHVFFKTYS